MLWPEKPTCHEGQPFADLRVPQWDDPRPDDEPNGIPYRTCSYCGSLHPEDLLHALRNGATLDRTDMKYGWPHKFYVNNIPNPLAGKQVRIGSRSGPNPDGTRYEEVIMGTAPETVMLKWYNQHLKELSGEAFAELVPLLTEKSGIEWVREDDGRVKWRLLAKGG